MIFLFLFLSLFQVSHQENLASQVSAVFDLENFTAESNINHLNLNDLIADSVLVKEINGKTLFSYNADKQKEIASLTKLMSAYIGYLIYPNDKNFIFTPEAIAQEGNVGYFYVGEKISRDDILKAGLVASSNDAIYLLAQEYGLDKFVNLMNEKAKEWKMLKTNFVDPTGLGKNISTSLDLYLMLVKIYSQAPEIFDITRLGKIIVNGKILWTTNLLLDKYRSIIVGAKTGYKGSAGENLALILKFNKSPFLSVIILDSKDRWQDAEKIIKALKYYYGE
ncbi:MAG: hypothetical protein KatS3mg096_174 [Candidatus Parcubacteria bacterium]|nr:MAG: hypothetical protein KatS3mg093_418 [Candidatus Parcubacteria bacterium]GIW67129.1 MAG: hypothetical protein KatS3mg095_1027 [Candidatus Parcubacteria bacterium]GIW67306.1 MAG: hypothetical protein KatS3mg096_174 [Candidatus Parcubacteria bacterium]